MNSKQKQIHSPFSAGGRGEGMEEYKNAPSKQSKEACASIVIITEHRGSEGPPTFLPPLEQSAGCPSHILDHHLRIPVSVPRVHLQLAHDIQRLLRFLQE